MERQNTQNDLYGIAGEDNKGHGTFQFKFENMFILIKAKYYWQKNRLTDKLNKIEFPQNRSIQLQSIYIF